MLIYGKISDWSVINIMGYRFTIRYIFFPLTEFYGRQCNILKENPKVKKSAIRFDLYQEGLTVGEYIEKCGKISPEEKKKAKPDIKWDYARKFISFR